VTFTSSSTVTNLLEALKRLGEPDPVALLGSAKLYAIGPVTAQTAADAGLTVRVTSGEATIASLVQALAEDDTEEQGSAS
jgi:uroporphyrinogen III methyltransferase/synthase